ncbi:MAG: hypothetical protein RL274_969 [Pseudomonadota bacterium]|jgi:phosphatidylinositol glycan class B
MSPDLARILRRSLAILAGVAIVTAWFSQTFYFPDEHYQVLEFMSYKLGITPASELPWEFDARIRPWLQPLLYFLIAKPLLWLGDQDMFAIVFVLRLVTGLFSVAALAIFARAVLETLKDEAEKRAFALYLPFFGFLPYLFVRTSSETLSAAFFAIAVTLTMRGKSARLLALSGVLCGLAFEARYQTAMLGLGLFAWLAVIARVQVAGLAVFVGGGLAALALGALANRWGYGAWVFPPWDYFQVNIVQGVAAKSFGREPVFAYLYLLPAQLFFAITLVLMAGMTAMWLRNPRHVLTWATIPFVLLHMVVAHKEARFLFPLAILATAFPVLGFSPRLPRWQGIFTRVWNWRNSIAAKAMAVLSVAGMIYFALYPFGVRPHMPMAQYLYRHVTGPIYSFAAPFQSYPMYRRAGFRSEKLQSPMQLEGLLGQGPIYLLSNSPVPPPATPADAVVTLLYSEFPLARFGFGAAGTRYIQGYTAFAARHGWLKLLPLTWYTLYRVERSATIRS